MTPHRAAASPAIGRQIQNPRPKLRGEQREGIGADRIEGDIAEIEQPGEADHDVQPPAEHDVGQHQDRQVEQIAQRQIEMERLVQEIGADREQHGEGDAADREDAGVGKIGEEIDDDPPHQPDGQECQHESRDELTGRAADNAADDKDDQPRRSAVPAEHDDIAPVEHLLREQPGERRGEGMLGLPHEQIEQEPAEEHDADGDGQEHRARLEGKPGHIVDRAESEQQAEQREGDDGGEQGVGEGRLEPLAERCAGLRQGAQTFSTSGRPSRPVGKKMSTMASIENAATSLYSMVK